MDKKLGKGMLAILMANLINLFFNLITNFILPKYLSVDSYSAIKTYQLYVTYVGIFALGYTDGMYLRYGGRDIDSIDKGELKTGLSTIRILMIIETLAFLVLAFLSNNKIMIGFVMSIMSLNMAGYFKNLYQAVGEFKRYGKILNLTTIFTFIINVVLLFLVQTDNYFIYLLGYAAVNLLIWILLEWNFKTYLSNVKNAPIFSWELFLKDTKAGILLLIGNFSSILLTTMDRWFVKAFFGNLEFAQYSFAVSLEGFLNTATTPITVTMYNFLCKKQDEDTIKKSRKYVLIFSSVIIASAFPAKFIVEIYLQKYLGAMSVLFILFAAQMLFIPNKAIYVNLYKAKNKQKDYFIKLVAVIILGALSNRGFVLFYDKMESFAYATLFSALIWLAFSIWDFREYKIDIKEIAYLLLVIFIFLLFGFKFNSIIGLLMYILCVVIAMFGLFGKELHPLIVYLLGYIHKNRQKKN